MEAWEGSPRSVGKMVVSAGGVAGGGVGGGGWRIVSQV
jgi:hypothetical protein